MDWLSCLAARNVQAKEQSRGWQDTSWAAMLSRAVFLASRLTGRKVRVLGKGL